MVSGDVAYRVMYILAFIGAVPLSIVGLLFVEDFAIDPMLNGIGESNTIVVQAIVAAVFVSVVILIMFLYPMPRESFLSLGVGFFSSALVSIILWSWLTYEYEYKLPLSTLSEFYTVATLTFLDVLLAAMAILVAVVTTTERM